MIALRRVQLMRIAEIAVVFLILLFLVTPGLVVIPLSFAGDVMQRFPPDQWSLDAYRNFFESSAWMRATYFSLKMAGLVMLFAVLLGTLTAYGLVRLKGGWSSTMAVLVLLPMVVPTVIYALAVFGLLSKMGLLGTMSGFVLANLVLAAPYAIITIRTGMEGLDWSLFKAASVLGAHPPRTVTRIGLPLLLPSIAAGALFSFLIAFDEVVVAQFISGPFAVPLPKQMWDGILYRWDPAISAISTIQIAITILVLVVLGLLQRRNTRM